MTEMRSKHPHLDPRKGETAGAAHEPPPTIQVLSAFYAHVTHLHSLLPSNLVQPNDTEDFKKLFQGTIICDTQREIQLRVEGGHDLALSKEGSIKELLERVRTRLNTQHTASLRGPQRPIARGSWVNKRPPNILAAGFDSNQLHSGVVNTTVETLCQSAAWKTLLDRIGHTPLFTLFSSPTTALFTPLPNFCYLQISGQRIADLIPRHTSLFQRNVDPNSFKKDRRRRCDRPRKRGKRKASEVIGNENEHARVPDIRVTDSHTARLSTPPPAKRRKLGSSVSAPQLMTSPLKGVPSPLQSPLRPTRSGAALLEGTLAKGVKRKVTLIKKSKRPSKRKQEEDVYSLNAVLIPRTRIFHASPCRKTSGGLKHGFVPQHIFSRLWTTATRPPASPASSDPKNLERKRACHLAKYIFPRQYGLFNPFTNMKPLKGYAPSTLNRSAEIAELGNVKVPKRIKAVLPLLERLVKLQRKCDHRRLLNRYCPSKLHANPVPDQEIHNAPAAIEDPKTQISAVEVSIELSHPSLVVPHGAAEAATKAKAKPRVADYLCGHHEVEAYVLAVVRETIPRDFWGSASNEKLMLDHVSSFVRFRRYETFTVHTLLQGFCVSDCDWLQSLSTGNDGAIVTKNDMVKRRDLLADFVFWFFDGFVIEILRGSFNITEGAAGKNRTLYFRHDDWKVICKPQWVNLIKSNFEAISKATAHQVLKNRELGYSFVRLLPKETGMRPIVNLGMRPKMKHAKGNLKLGSSINTLLQPVFQALTYEKNNNPRLMGAAVDLEPGIYPLLKSLKRKLLAERGCIPALYFVKVDVRSAFDTIKQEKLLDLISVILTEKAYRLQKFDQTGRSVDRVCKRWLSKSFPNRLECKFPDLAASLAETIRHAVFSDRVAPSSALKTDLYKMLEQHVTNNVVQIKGKFYRQKDGIPQGSVLSSLLCNLFYGDMEQTVLEFTRDPESLLMRYIDDSLFITPDCLLARRFLHQMHQGIPEYGCFISGEKILTNFDASLEGVPIVPSLPSVTDFPFCGLLVNTETLDVKAETARYEDVEIADKLTVEKSRKPGEAFISKMLLECRRRTHAIYSDTNGLNSLDTAYLNIYQSFLFVALKFRAYVREWGVNPRKRAAFFLGAIHKIESFVCSTIKSRLQTKVALKLGAKTQMKKPWIAWLCSHAFYKVLARKPSLYGPILAHLAKEVGRGRRTVGKHLKKVTQSSTNAFIDGIPWKRK